jgi:hypothetical protein
VSEPTTAVTDYLLGAMTAFWALQLFRRAEARRSTVDGGDLVERRPSGRRSAMQLLWSAAFAATAIGALAGGAWHGVRERLAGPMPFILWKTTLISIGAGSFCLGAGIAVGWIRSRGVRIAAIAILGAQLAWYLTAIARSDDFRTVVADYGSVMIAILLAALVRFRDPAARWIIGGIGVSFAAAAVQASRLRLGTLDHNGLYHLIQIGGLYLLFRGGSRLTIPPTSDSY